MASFPPGSFEYILCSNSMVYLQHPEATLGNFHLWLPEGGKLCFNNVEYHNDMSCPANGKYCQRRVMRRMLA